MKPGIIVSGLVAIAVGSALLAFGLISRESAGETEPGERAASAAAAPEGSGFVTAYRRLTESQYRRSIADIFSDDIQINARFEPEKRVDGLQAVGNADLSITTSGLEQYFSVARSIAEQATGEERRETLIGCDLASVSEDARACMEDFVRTRGRLLFRRPLSDSEVATRMEIWDGAAEQSGDAAQAARLTLVSLLVAPEFLFRAERAEPDPAGGTRLDGWTKAARLSFVLWDAAPDDELLAAAESGALHTEEGLGEQIERLLSSPRFEDGVRAFFTDMLYFEAFDSITKDPQAYPKYSQAVADSAREETLRFLVRNLVVEERPYLDVFTSRDTALNRTLAAVYRVPYPSREPWTDFTFPEDSGRSGLLTQVTFASLFSHPASSSPTLRGKHIQEIFLCTKIPDPPADVDFSAVQALDVGTVRERLVAHRSEPACAGCHIMMDPAGLALENFDSIGQFRTTENGAPIDVGAELDGERYEGAAGVGRYLRDHPRVPACIVQKAYDYGVGRPNDYSEMAYLTAQEEAFAAGGYKLRDLFRNMLSHPTFFKVVRPEGLASGPVEASSNPQRDTLRGEG